MSSGAFRGIATKFANILGYNKLLPMIETEDTYVQIPIQLADRLGKNYSSSYSPTILSVGDRISKLRYNDDYLSHIQLQGTDNEFMEKIPILCPANCYAKENDNIILQYEGCLDCGTCSQKTEWKHPRGEKGIHYRYG